MNNTSIGFNIDNHHSKVNIASFHSNNHSKLLKTKIADSGTDPKGSLIEFFNHDLVKPVVRPKLDIYQRDNSVNNTKWAIGTTKKCVDNSFLPKLQPFRETFYYEKRSQEQIEKYKSSFLKTDNVAIKQEPLIGKLNNTARKPNLLYSNYESKDRQKDFFSYDYKTLNNKSSSQYNILNLQENYISKKPIVKLFDIKAANMIKGISEFSDLTRDFAPNYNNDYKNEIQRNSDIFKRKTGIFSHIYDRSHRNGNMVAPFGNRDNSKSEITSIYNRFTMKNISRKQNYLAKEELKKKIN